MLNEVLTIHEFSPIITYGTKEKAEAWIHIGAGFSTFISYYSNKKNIIHLIMLLAPFQGLKKAKRTVIIPIGQSVE